MMNVCTTLNYFPYKVVYSLLIKGNSTEPRVRYKSHTLLCTANNVKTCNAQQVAVGYLTMKERDLLEGGADSSSNKTFPTFFATRTFVTVFTTAQHLFIS
jgi:nitrous oxidase accessory protein NosD